MNHHLLVDARQNVRQQPYAGEPERSKMSSVALPRRAVFAMLLAMGTVLLPAAANAGTLSNTVLTQLTLPASCPSAPGCGSGPIGVFPTVTNHQNNTFDGNWPNTVDVSWQGSFSGTGPYPAKNGTNTFDFSNLTNHVLPTSSLIIFGDLDDGSGNEDFTLRALDSSNNPIASPWLQDIRYVSGADPSDFTQGNMPEYKWSPSNQTYYFDGASVTGFPTIAVWLTTNTDIAHLVVTSDTDFASFGMAAPAPEPGSLLLMGSGIAGLAGLLRRRLIG